MPSASFTVRVADRRPARRGGYSLLEILFVLVLIGLLAALLLPSLESPLAGYHIQQVAGEVRTQLIHARLRAMETGVPHGVTYYPHSDRYFVWSAGQPVGRANPADYEREMLNLNRAAGEERFRFLPPAAYDSDTVSATGTRLHSGVAMGTGYANASRARRTAYASNPTHWDRSAVPIVFAADGTANWNSRVRIGDGRSDQYVDIQISAATGAIRISKWQ